MHFGHRVQRTLPGSDLKASTLAFMASEGAMHLPKEEAVSSAAQLCLGGINSRHGAIPLRV